MKTQHDGDCTINADLEYLGGICTCGYGLQLMREDDYSEIISGKLIKKLEEEGKKISLDDAIEIMKEGGWKRSD